MPRYLRSLWDKFLAQFAPTVPPAVPASPRRDTPAPDEICLPDGGPCPWCGRVLEPWELHPCRVRTMTLSPPESM